ncbi:hypothetical protein BMR07_15215 [Methylococcaceae bacterium CS1]|nr:hypothetical protein [Methyloprofundus sp.]TXK94186.1 hypothetical protein BMR10_13900 [Methylococcaceae bacterium CS4]TXK95001.1 hypothetical protein BMR11_14300 [Methylococcaceae bacterium CS5]TXL02930.1 hypothetical protein BMR09_15940 [Methylococcaceae bacterium CS3]TXL03439.1 hypothetical protein BMR07_15215 [Methylococcaceae bacterium CS1]TXL04554.1 hypothetical protein BMR08_16565 [Methylococcaceae bacterium CS2]
MTADSKNKPVPTLEKIYQQCHKKTRIVYNDEGFFTPSLRSINYLSIGRSRIISSPITISLEFLYIQYKKIRDAWQIFLRLISPKPMNAPIEPGELDSKLVGRITFAGHNDEHTPIHNMHIVFWTRTWLLQWRKLAEGLSDKNGEFELAFSLRNTRKFGIYGRYFQIYQTRYSYVDGAQRKYQYKLFKSIKIPASDLVGMQYNLKTIPLFYWEYRCDTSVPRVVIKDHDKDAPQYYSQGRNDAIKEQFIPIELTKLNHLEQIAENPASLSIQKIQSDYPSNLTVCMESKQSGITRSDEWFGLRMMNGMYAATFVQDKVNKDFYWSHFYGACDYSINHQYALPNIKIKFRLDEQGIMMPREIHLIGPLTAHEKNPWREQVFTVNDGDKWLQAKRVARVTAALSTELDDHYAGTHLTTEQFAIAAYRNLRLNPIAALLFPHLKEVVLINHSGDRILVGPANPDKQSSPSRSGGFILWLQDYLNRSLDDLLYETGGYIPQASALTSAGINERVRDLLGVQNWHDWKPMPALSDRHYFPKAQQAYWDILGEYVNRYIDDNIKEIREHWHEIYCFSNDLVKHSVPLYLSDVDLKQLDKNAQTLAKERLEWYQQHYHINLSSPRETINGELKVLSPITLSARFSSAGIQNLKESCRYIIMMATFMHSFVNEHQYDDIGEVLYNCLGLRFGESKDGIMAAESDTRIAPDLTRSTQMMWFSNLLSRTEYGFIVRNEENDINPELIRMLIASKEKIELNGNGMLIENIESRTNI